MALPSKAPPLNTPLRTKKVLQEVLDTLNSLDLPELDVASIEALQAETKALRQRKLVSVVVAGAAKETNIAVAGVNKANDTIVSVVRFDLEAGGKLEGVTDLTSDASITSDGNIQLKTTVTTGDKLLVLYYDANGNP